MALTDINREDRLVQERFAEHPHTLSWGISFERNFPWRNQP